MTTPLCALLVPVKPTSVGKSRLTGLDDALRRALATAFALDTVTACLAAGQVGAVLLVTDDLPLATEATALGCAAIPDVFSGQLNASLREAAAEARRRWPTYTPVALCADLPALDAADLDAALLSRPLDAASFVADAPGDGTTMYAAPHEVFDPQFGAQSRAAHRASGAVELQGELATLRCDVDDLADLARAEALGLGSRTRAVVAGLHDG